MSLGHWASFLHVLRRSRARRAGILTVTNKAWRQAWAGQGRRWGRQRAACTCFPCPMCPPWGWVDLWGQVLPSVRKGSRRGGGARLCSWNSGLGSAVAGGRPGPGLPFCSGQGCMQGPCGQTWRCWRGRGEPAPCLNQPMPADGGSHRARRPFLWDVQQGRLGGELLTAGQAQTLLS